MTHPHDRALEAAAIALCYASGNEPFLKFTDGRIVWQEYTAHARAAVTAYIAALQPRQLLSEAMQELTKTPLIEAITPTSDEWRACETVQDTYDLMKHRIQVAAIKIRAPLPAPPAAQDPRP
jgi:hypothetical protein